MAHYAIALLEQNKHITLESELIFIAAAFHDLGLWTKNTMDYIDPSKVLADAYLQNNDLKEWNDEILLMIDQHHKLTPFRDKAFPGVEIFRKADLIDLSWGIIHFDIDPVFIDRVKTEFPNAHFHLNLTKRILGWVKNHPLHPLPMMKA